MTTEGRGRSLSRALSFFITTGSPAGEAEESSDGDEDSDGSTRLAAARGMAHRENSDERNREGATDGGDGPTDGGDGPKEEEEDDERKSRF